MFVCCPGVCDRYWALEARDAIRLLVPLGHHVEAGPGPTERAVVGGHGSPIVMHQSHRRPFIYVTTAAYEPLHVLVSHYLVMYI